MNDSTTKPKTYRLSEETTKQFEEISKTLNLNAENTLNTIISAYLIDQSKQTNTSISKNIDSFIYHLNAIQSEYNNIISINADAEERIRSEFARQLDSKDSIIIKLQGDIAAAENKLNDSIQKQAQLQAEHDNIASTLDKVTAENTTLKNTVADKNKIISSLEQDKAEHEQIKLDAQTIKTEYDRLVAEQHEQQNKIALLEQHNKQLSETIEKLKLDFEKERQIDIKLAIAETKEMYIDRIEKLNEQINKLNKKLNAKDNLKDE